MVVDDDEAWKWQCAHVGQSNHALSSFPRNVTAEVGLSLKLREAARGAQDRQMARKRDGE